ILYQLVKDGISVFVTTAYLDEAERCNRVGLLDKGKLIRCDTPDALKRPLQDTCFEVESPNLRATRDFLRRQEGVVSAQPSGRLLHVFLKTSPEDLKRRIESEGLGPVEFRPIVPSLEDVFIALVGKAA